MFCKCSCLYNSCKNKVLVIHQSMNKVGACSDWQIRQNGELKWNSAFKCKYSIAACNGSDTIFHCYPFMFLKTLLWVLFVLFVSVSVRARAGRMATTEEVTFCLSCSTAYGTQNIIYQSRTSPLLLNYK